MALGKLSTFKAKLQGRGVELKYAVVAGAAASTNIAIAGLGLADQLLAVIEFQPPTAAAGNAMTDRGSVASITSAGNIQLTAATTGNQLLVIYAQAA